MEATGKVPKQEHKKYDYYAFISYKHAKDDTNKFVADEKWAHILKQQLELWHIPTQVPEEKRLNKNDKRIYPVFRDAENYPSGQLDELTCDRLSKCKTLVVVLSKEMLDDQIKLRYKEQDQTAFVFEEIEKFIKLGNTKDSIVIFYVGDDGINPNELLKEKIDLCKLNNWDCKALEYLYKPGEIIKKLRDFKDKGKEINQYVTAAVAAGIFNAAPEYFINAYELERKNRRNKVVIFLLLVVILLLSIGAFAWVQFKSRKTEEAFRYVELSKKAADVCDVQGSRILALKAYDIKPDLLEAQQQMYNVSNEKIDEPYAILPFQVLSHSDGTEIMHFQDDKFFIRRTLDLVIIDSILGESSPEEVLLSNDGRKIVFVSFDSLKIYDRDLKEYVLCHKIPGYYSRDLDNDITGFHFPIMKNRFLGAHRDGCLIDWNLQTKDSLMIPINDLVTLSISDESSYRKPTPIFMGNINDTCVAFRYTIDSVCYVCEYNCMTQEINKLDSFQTSSWAYNMFCNPKDLSLMLFEENDVYIKAIGKNKMRLDIDSVDIPNHYEDKIFSKTGDKFVLTKNDSIFLYTSEGILIKEIDVSKIDYSVKDFVCANWTSTGDLCVQCEKSVYILSAADNYSKLVTFKRPTIPNYFSRQYVINVFDSVIIETSESYDPRNHIYSDCLSRFYYATSKIQKNVNAQNNRYFLPDGIHYIEHHYGFLEPCFKYRDSVRMKYTRCVNSVNDSVVWKYPCSGTITMSPNRERVCVEMDFWSDSFVILKAATGSVLYESNNDTCYFDKFINDDVIAIKERKEDRTTIIYLKSNHNLVDGVIKSSTIAENSLACVIKQDDNTFVSVVDIETGREMVNFPLPNRDYYDIYFSPCARYLVIPCRDFLSDLAKGLASVVSDIVFVDVKKRITKMHNDASLSCIFTHDGKYVLTLFFRHANLYALKDFSLMKTFNFSEDMGSVKSYVSLSNIYISNNWRGGKELNTRNWTLKVSEYASVQDCNDYVFIDGFLYEKEPLLKRNKKNIIHMTDDAYGFNPDRCYINDSIMIIDEKKLVKLRNLNDLEAYLKKCIGNRVLTKYEINCYSR